jgi:GH25 family lysozyme M1 (1,4-beta-N-acetylmuramidase)
LGKIADISKWQDTIDWSKASTELDLVIIRVQYGSSTIDSKYKEYVAGAKQYNIPFGHYAYAQYTSVNDAIQEAKDFWSRSDKNALFYAIDVEEITTKNASDLVPATQAFIDYLHNQGAKKVGLYSGDSFYKSNGLSKVNADFLWIARYGVNNGSPSTKPSVACDLWQYSSKGSLSGVTGNVDLNALNGTKTLSYFTGSTAVDPTPPTPPDPTNTGGSSGDTGSTGGTTGSSSGTDNGGSTGSGGSGSGNNGGGTTIPPTPPTPPMPPIPQDTSFINPNSNITNYIVKQGDDVPRPQIFLATKNETVIHKISDANNKKLTINFTTPNEFSLSIPYVISIQDKLVRNPVVDDLREGMLIKLLFAGIETWYVISKKEPTSDDTSDWLNIDCYSREYELGYKKIIGYTAKSFNCIQVLSDGLKGTNWNIGYINDDFNLSYKQFDVSSTTRLDFINQICEAFNGYAVFDTVSRKVNICKEEEVSAYKGFWIEYGKYLQTIDQSVDIDEVVTRLHVTGSDTVTINTVNPTGQSYIDNFSYFLYPFSRDSHKNVISHSYYMSDSLCNAILDYNAVVNANESSFSNLLATRTQLQTDLTKLNNDLSTLQSDLQQIKDDIAVAQKASMPTADLIKKRNSKQSEVDAKNTEINAKNDQITSNDSAITALNKLLAIENNITGDLFSELQDYIQEDEFSDSNQTTDVDLYASGVQQLNKVYLPPINLSLGIVNFYAVLEEKLNWNRLSIGDIVRIKHSKLDIDVKATVTQLSFDFESNGIGITVSSVTRPQNIMDKFSSAFNTINKYNIDYSKRKPEWDQLLTNFNARNDRISTVPSSPVLADDAVSHKVNDNGTVDLTITWNYNDFNKTKKDADNIDGFNIYLHPDDSNNSYSFGATLGLDQVVPVSFDLRSYTFPFVPANKFYTLGVQAYRVVDNDISSNGYLFSKIVMPSGDKQNPYLPSEVIIINGNINGKVNGVTHTISSTAPDNPDTNDKWTDTSGVAPVDNVYIGNSWVKTASGTADSAAALGSYTADVANSPSTIPVRDSDGTIDAHISGDAKTVSGMTPGAANGIATLDSNGYIPQTQLGNTPQVASGTYVGDGTSNKAIPLSFAPSLVKVYTTDYTDYDLFIPSTSGGFLRYVNNTSEHLQGDTSTKQPSALYGKLSSTGFICGSDVTAPYGNKSNVTYYYEAIKANP